MEAWESFINQQELELGSETVQKWLRTLKVIRFDACNIYLEAKDRFQALWFEEHIRPKILAQLFNNNNKKIRVHLTIAAAQAPSKDKKSKFEATPPKFSLTFNSIDPYSLFSTFIPEQENELVFKLLSTLSVTENMPPEFNPIYIYGPKGSGKTHLLMAATAELRNNGIKAIYTNGESFTEHLISAIRTGEMSSFRNAYRNIDALIIDDVHIFSRKAATQEEFFHTFNTLHLAGKQIIVSANCSPQELASIEPRLISRFEWGIALPLVMLSKKGLLTMIMQKGESLNYKPSQKIIEFLLATFNSGPSAITKALQALILRSHLNESHSLASLSTIKAAQLLEDLIAEEAKLQLTPEKIFQYVAEYFGLLPTDILEKSQTRERVVPRQIAMFFCRQYLKLPYTKIALLFKKDHSTVMSSIKLVQKGIENRDSTMLDPIGAIGPKL